MSAVQTLLTVVLIIATSVWLGGYAAIAVVARTTTKTLDPAARVEFFRSLGRTFLPIGGTALVLAYACGLALITVAGWTATAVAALIVAVALVVVLGVAVRQARMLTRLRTAVLAENQAASSTPIARRAKAANALRGTIGVLSLTLVVLGAVLAG